MLLASVQMGLASVLAGPASACTHVCVCVDKVLLCTDTVKFVCGIKAGSRGCPDDESGRTDGQNGCLDSHFCLRMSVITSLLVGRLPSKLSNYCYLFLSHQWSILN